MVQQEHKEPCEGRARSTPILIFRFSDISKGRKIKKTKSQKGRKSLFFKFID
jgi:hypothetical protein